MGKLIGIYGGSFNPIHFVHKWIAKDCIKKINDKEYGK